jgi:hypothetical protein
MSMQQISPNPVPMQPAHLQNPAAQSRSFNQLPVYQPTVLSPQIQVFDTTTVNFDVTGNDNAGVDTSQNVQVPSQDPSGCQVDVQFTI